MPELPEVETVRRSLGAVVLGRTVRRVTVRQRVVVKGPTTPRALLVGRHIIDIQRHGKQLAILTDADTCLCVHLGMTGSLLYRLPGPRGIESSKHVHVKWRLDNGAWLLFRDPRRFGRLWPFADFAALRAVRWQTLGPDALTIRRGELAQRLYATCRAVKAALLDQNLIAGLGNIYVDEALFAAGINPRTPASKLGPEQVTRLTTCIHRVLRQAIAAGGSTLRDFVDGQGKPGFFQSRHLVYGRGGEPCRRCGRTLPWITLAGRRTVFCPTCQPRCPCR